MSSVGMRLVASAAGVAALLFSTFLATAQEPKAGNQRQPSAEAESKKVDEIAEAARQLDGPAGQPECVWAGRLAVHLLIKNDIDTAFRHMELYDRFGCPPGHIQMAFRCLVRLGTEMKAQELSRAHACWVNPNVEFNLPAAAAAPSATTNR
jgi:hypothetical protein